MVKKKDEEETKENEPEELVSTLVKHINKKGKAAYSLYDGNDPSNISDWISTGSSLLDYAISNRPNGGIPYGRITEIHGQESTGKSLLALQIIANAQKKNGLGVLLDTEQRRLEKDFVVRLGINPKRFVSLYPYSIEESFECIEETIKAVRKDEKKRPIVVVWDSLAASPPQAEQEGSYDPQSQMGLGAKAVARGIRKLTSVIGTENIALIIINQLRMNPKALAFTDPYITPYGKALPYAASVRLRVAQSTKIKDASNEAIGYSCLIKTVKNSLGPPNRSVRLPLLHGYGIDDKQSIYDFLHEKKLITKSVGLSRFKFEGLDLNFPHNQWKKVYDENKEAFSLIIEKLMIKKYDDHNPDQDHDFSYDADNVDSEI